MRAPRREPRGRTTRFRLPAPWIALALITTLARVSGAGAERWVEDTATAARVAGATDANPRVVEANPIEATSAAGDHRARLRATISDDALVLDAARERSNERPVASASPPATTHSPRFVEFMAKHAKHATYCPDGDGVTPCEESLFRERVFKENARKIDAHNARRDREGGGGMRMGVTKFADLSPEEFSKTHGYVAGGGVGATPPSDDDAIEKEEAAEAEEAEAEAEAEREVDVDVASEGSPRASVGWRPAAVGIETLGSAPSRRRLLASASPSKTNAAAMPAHLVEVAKHRLERGAPHAETFMNFVRKFHKAPEYCGGEVDSDAFPCLTSYEREQIVLHHEREINAHNAGALGTDSGMRKTVTKFADMLPEEFAGLHAKYSSSPNSGGARAPSESAAGFEPVTVQPLSSKPAGVPSPRETSSAKLGATDPYNSDDSTTTTKKQSWWERLKSNLYYMFTDPIGFFTGKDPNTDGTFTLGAVVYPSLSDVPGLPTSQDWTKSVDTGSVYSQGDCSGCWAYTAVDALAASKSIATGTRPNLSPQFLLSCDTLDNGCDTGNMATAYAWIQTSGTGVMTEDQFSANGGRCEWTTTSDAAAGGASASSALGWSWSSAAAAATRASAAAAAAKKQTGVNIDGFCDVVPLSGNLTVHAILKALRKQPVAIGLNVKPLQLYGGGIATIRDCPPASSDKIKAINHAAVLVGWGVDSKSGRPYFIMKNSYGADWGENGYARLDMGFDEATGMGACALGTESNYPRTDDRACADGSTTKWAEKRNGDVYLMPDNVVVLPNGGGIVTPSRFVIFGYDCAGLLKILAIAAFFLCAYFLFSECLHCLCGRDDDEYCDAEEGKITVRPRRGKPGALLQSDDRTEIYGSSSSDR